MLLSIIIPVYNTEHWLPRCLDSVTKQLLPEMEVIAVNDGSTDSSASILQQYAEDYPAITVLTQPNRGQAAARNAALKQAKGTWILFLDADDYWTDGYLAEVLPELTDNVDVLQTGYTQNAPVLCTRPYRFLSAWSKIIRRDFLLKHKILFPEGQYYDDPVWAARLWKANPRIALSINTKYNYTINSQSITANPKPITPLLRELRKMGLHPWDFGWLRLRLFAHFAKEHISQIKHHMKQPSLVICLLLSAWLPLHATTYYCSPTGKGNGNSYNTPCSFSNGLNKLSSPGDTLYLLGGQYDLGNTSIANKNGNASRYIVISGYPGETAILDFRSTPYGTRGLQVKSTCTYLHIKDLTLRYSGKNNLHNEGSYCFFEHLDIYGSADTGCQMKNGGNNIIKNVDSHDNFDYKQYNSSNQADFGGNADGFADKQFTGAGNHYIGCRAWNNSDDGWDFFQRISNSETIIENCICYQNGPAEYDMRNHPRYQTDKSWFDQINGTTVTSRYNTQVTVTLQHYPNMGNGNGFKLGGGYTNHQVHIHHCLAIANTVRGFDQNNNDGTMRVYNNTGYDNGVNFGFTTVYGNLRIQNCVSYASRSNDATQSKITSANDHNTWNSNTGVTLSAADFLSRDTTQVLKPRLANGDLTLFSESATVNNTLFHLATGSDLIDAGTNVGLTFYGNAPDLGCFESSGFIRPSIVLSTGPEVQWVMEGDSITPLVFTWSGVESKPTSSKPTGIFSKVSNTNKTVTFTGAIATAGVYTISVTTTADSLNVTATATIHVRPNACKRVAWVTVPGSASDNSMLQWLSTSDSIVVTELDVTQTNLDCSDYDAIVISPAPASSAASFSNLKGYPKPMLVLKPFLFKNTVWNWGNSQNTSDLTITVQDTSHALFDGLTFTNGNQLQLFSTCNTNAVTAISSWTDVTGQTELASPISQPTYSTITEFPAGSSAGTVTFQHKLLMIGLSEYSTANLTDTGLQLVENAIYYLLGMPIPGHSTDLHETLSDKDNNASKAKKLFRNGQLLILHCGQLYTPTGIPVGEF